MTAMYPRVQLEMTWRARFYLTVASGRHGAFALVALLLYDQWPNVDAALPIWGWGIVFGLGSLHLAYSAITASETHARVALALSAVITSVWAAAFWGWWLAGEGSPIGAILFTALTLKDLTIVRDPMRSPFEPILREYVDEAEE